jgi:TP901 family phage tail tape measure protein
MSDFKVKVTADLDTSQLEAKLMALQNRKITIQANANGNGLSNMNNSLQQIQNNANNVSASLKGIATTKLKVDALNFLKNQTENAVRSVTDLNKAMTLVNMTMSNMSGSSLYSLKQQSLSMAKALSTATKTVTDAVTIYANENESVSSMLNKAQPTVLLSAASGMSSSSSADAIQGILNQFNLSEDQAMHVADTVEKLSSEIALDFSKGCDTISQSIATSGSVVNEAGMSFEKYAALVSTTAEKTRVSGSQIGNAFKTIFSRISRSKDGLTTDAEMSDAEAALKSVGVSVRGADGDLRDISDTLDNLNEVWGTLNHSQRSYVAEMAAGVRQKNIFEAAMDSYNKALQLEQDALNSDGTAMKINEKRADSINGKMEKLSATMTQLYSDAMPEEAIEGMIDFATAVAKVVDNFGLFQGALSSLGVVGGAKIISTIASNWTGLLSAITSPLGIGTIAVGGAVAAISAYQKSVSEMVESAKQAGDEWESGQENLQGQIDKISELRTALDSGTLSEQEAASAKSELLSIQESLSESYGSQVASIDLVNGSLTEQIALLDKVSAKEAERFQNENEKGIDKATKEIEKERHEYLGQFYDNGTQESEDIKKSIKDLQDKYGDDVFTTELEADGITMDLHFNADASTAREALNDFKTDISDIKKQYGESDVLNLLGDNASAGLSKANKVLDEYGDLYNQAQKAKLVADDDLYKAPSGKEQTAVKWLNDETKAVEAYNDALSEGNSDAIKQASTEFEAVDSAVQSLLKNSGMSEYADQFTEVKDQLNESAISANKFNEALSGNDSSKFGKQVKKSADALKELGLTDTDFKYAFETDGVQEGEDQINSLVDSAIQCGYISDTSSEQVSKLVSVLSSLGVISSTTGEAVGDATEEVASSVDTMSDALDSAKEKQTNLIDALGNSRSATGLTKDDINNVTSAFKDLDNFDPASIFEETATGVHLNTQALKEYNDELEQQTKNNFAEAITNKQQELNDAIAQNKSQDVIDGLQEEVQTLQLLSAQYDGATSSYNKFVTAASSANERDSFEDVAKSYESIGQLIEQGWTTDDSVTSYLDLLLGTDRIQDSQQAYEQLGQTIEGTGHSLKDYMTFDDDGNFTSQGAWSFVDDVANKLGDDFVKIGEDGEYAFDLTGDKINQVADAFNTTTDFVELMGKALADAGANVSFDSSDVKNYNEQMKQLQETANTTQEKLKEVQSATSGESGEGLLSGIDLNYDKASMSIDQLDSKIAELSGKREEISVSADTEEGQQAISALDNEIASLQSQKIMVSIGTQLEGGATVDELLAITDDAELAAKLQIDVSQVAEARQQLQTLKDTGNIEVPVTVKLDEGQFNSLIESLTGEAVEVPAEVETPEIPDVSGETVEYPSKVDTPDVPDVSGEEITYTATVDTPDLPDIQGGIAYYEPQVEGSADGETAEGTINYDKGTVESADGETSEGIINYDKGDVEKADGTVSTGTINYDLGTVAVPTGMVASGTINYALGTVATPGKAMGTFGQARAYAKGSLTDFPAYGDGRVSLPNDQKALVNEEYINGHSESIVRDGVWSLIPGGAHMENLKKGDIIFSASQTEDLLKRGATPGHARAYAQGSLSDLSPLSNAFGSGFSGTGRNPWAGKNTSSSSSGGSSSSQQSYNDNSGAVSNNTSATEDNTKSAKDSTEAFDWVKTKLDKFAKSVERISNQITDYISSTFKTVLLKRQVKAVEKQLKANEQGYTAYMDKANSIDISDDYKNKVINGTFSIEEIDTSSDSGKQLAKDIKSFQTYYNSAQNCKDTVQELNNKLLELYETIVNMPTEKAEKKIDRLKTKLESLNAVSDTVSLGGSAIAAMQNQIKVDNPGLGNAQKKLDKAETARNITKKTRAKASKTLKSATVDAESTGNTLIKTSEKQTKSIGKKLKSAAKSSTNKATYNAIAQAIREGKPVNLKGLKGSALKYAKSYNNSLKQGNTIASKVKAGKTVKTSGMSNILKSTAQAYNTDAKEKASAQKVYDNAKKADEKALNDLTKAQKNKEKLYAGSTKEQQILATTKGKKSYVYQNMLLTQETKNLKEQNKQRQTALKETRDSYMKAKSKYDTADADKTKSQNKLLKNKTVMSKLNKTQQKALKAGKTVSTKGITDPKVLKWIQDYNEKVKKSTDLSKKLRIEQEALDKATSEAAQSQAEYAQSIVENAKKKLENIANYYDSFTSQWENRNSMYEAYMDRMQTQGYNLSTKFYEAEIGQQQKIVDNLSQKYIAMKRNFAQAVQDGTIVEGTEEYYEMQNEIDQVAISLKEAQNKVVEFQASIRDLKWEQFDQLQEAIGRITSESDFLIDLMSHKDMYDKDGNMTEQGLATMGLHGVNYNTYMAQADKYKEEMLKISEELANDPNNQKLIDRKNELIDAQQQAILSAEDEKDSIKDLIQDGIDKQLDALDDLIDKYLDCLDSEKDLYEYRKKIGEQSEKITSLQKQLSSLQGDNSEENKAKLQKLKEDLKSAQDDMEETQYDKYISDQKKLLDELKQDYKKALDDRMDNVDVLISDAIASINSNSSNISQTLQTESKNVGYTLSGEMQTIWTSQSGVISQYGDDFSSKLTGVNSAIENVYNRQKDMIDAIDAMAGKLIAKADQMLQQPTKTEGVLEEVEQKPDKDNVAEGNPTPDPPKVSDDESIRDAVLVDPDEPKKKPNKNDNKKTGNNKAEVGDKVTFSSGRYYEASDGTGASGNMYLGKKVKITRINKGSKYPYAIDATDGTELGWVKLNQLKGYASGIMRVPNDQLAWTQEQGEEAIVRNDGSILTPLSRDVSVLNADMTKNLWDFMGNPGSFLSDYSDGEKFGVKNVDNSSSVDVGGVTIQCNMPNVQNANDLLHELTTNKDIEKAICAMTIGRAMGGSSLAKYKYKK